MKPLKVKLIRDEKGKREFGSIASVMPSIDCVNEGIQTPAIVAHESNTRISISSKENKPPPREIVAGGDVRWKPVDRSAAMMIAKAPWWAKPPIDVKPKELRQETAEQIKSPKKVMKHNSQTVERIENVAEKQAGSASPTYTSDEGIRVKVVNGVQMLDLDDLNRVLCDQIAKLPRETRPNVQAAQDARDVIATLLSGIGAEMEQFRSNTKHYLEDIRQTRFAVVRETSEMVGPLKEVRQFFLGSDYKEELARLREFVDLCERLKKLKDSGFLDNVADTMLRLS